MRSFQASLLLLLTVCLIAACCNVHAWQQPNNNAPPKEASTTRRDYLVQQSATGAMIIAAATTSSCAFMMNVQPALAATSSTQQQQQEKWINLPNAELKEKILADIVDRQFLVTGKLTRSLYDESATFTDEIDTYGLEQWMKGTSNLFVSSKSHMDLEENSLQVSDSAITFRFHEYLCFNIPLLQPTVYLSGKVILERSPSNGLITSYKEQWDQDVNTVLKSAKLFS